MCVSGAWKIAPETVAVGTGRKMHTFPRTRRKVQFYCTFSFNFGEKWIAVNVLCRQGIYMRGMIITAQHHVKVLN